MHDTPTLIVDAKPPWSTASFGDAADTSPMELSVLGDHLDSCKRSHAGWFALQCAAERIDGFITARFVTTLTLAVLLMGMASMWS
jgi:hypothetical protein